MGSAEAVVKEGKGLQVAQELVWCVDVGGLTPHCYIGRLMYRTMGYRMMYRAMYRANTSLLGSDTSTLSIQQSVIHQYSQYIKMHQKFLM